MLCGKLVCSRNCFRAFVLIGDLIHLALPGGRISSFRRALLKKKQDSGGLLATYHHAMHFKVAIIEANVAAGTVLVLSSGADGVPL